MVERADEVDTIRDFKTLSERAQPGRVGIGGPIAATGDDESYPTKCRKRADQVVDPLALYEPPDADYSSDCVGPRRRRRKTDRVDAARHDGRESRLCALRAQLLDLL